MYFFSVQRNNPDFWRKAHRLCTTLVLAATICIATSAISLAQHTNDSFKQDEHTALLNLVPTSSANFQAQANGNWSSPSTWVGNAVPGAGAKVLIPSGITVTYDVNDTAGAKSLAWVRIDGTLNFSTSTTTKMVVDTLAVSPTIGTQPAGTLNVGTSSVPVASNVTATVLFSDSGALSTATDPFLMSRGLISHGNVSIYGAAKTSFATVGGLNAGASSITVDTAPSGWKVGDTIVISGSQIPFDGYYHSTYQDEKRTITSISGKVVGLSSPLTFNHALPTSPVVLSNYVANYTRNVTFQSANTDMTTNANIQRRGHVMFMHSAKVGVYNAAFWDLGRTNKDLLVDDAPANPMYVYENFSDPVLGSHSQGTSILGNGTNPRGRYSVHFHLCGSLDIPDSVDGTGPQYSANSAVICQGCAVMNSPGWGYSNHDSNVKFIDDVCYNSYGSGFVEESGNGIGQFNHCLSIRNGHNNTNPYAGDFREMLGLLDLGKTGNGFFYRGNLVDTINCVAVSCDTAGYTWVGKHGNGGSSIPSLDLPYPAIANGYESLPWDLTPFSVFKNSVAVACQTGVLDYYSQPTGDGRSMMDGLVLWNMAAGGIVTDYGNYSGQVTITNSTILADTSQYSINSRGMSVLTTFNDVVWNNDYVKGFYAGVHTENGAAGVMKMQLVDNCNLTQNTVPVDDSINPVTHFAPPTIITPTFVPDATQSNRQDFPLTLFGRGFNLQGTKTDSLGSERTGDQADDNVHQYLTRYIMRGDAIYVAVAKGYFTDTTGNYIIYPYAITDRVTGQVVTKYYKVYCDLSADNIRYFNGSCTVGPNLGTFVDPGTTTVPTPYLRLPGGSYATGQTVSVVDPLAGSFFIYTTDGSTPSLDSNGLPIGTTAIAIPPYSRGTSASGIASIPLPPGTNTLKVVACAGVMTPSAVVSATYTLPGGVPTGSAYNGPHNIPGTLQAEDYDTEGEGVAYHDTDTGNNGGGYRSDNVDIEGCTDTDGGYNVGWTAAGEYLQYTVSVATAGSYTVSFRVAATTSGNTFHLENASGTNLTGTLACPNTGGWQTWQNVTATITLPAGTQVLKLVEDTGGYNFNSITFTSAAPTYTKLSGTVIGTAGSYNNGGDTIAKVFDGNLSSFFDAPSVDGNWAGLDLGSGVTKKITKIRYVPRGGYASRMNGGIFQGSNDQSSWTNLYTVSATPPDGAWTETTSIGSATAFRYIRYLSPTGAYGNVAEVEFYTSP